MALLSNPLPRFSSSHNPRQRAVFGVFRRAPHSPPPHPSAPLSSYCLSAPHQPPSASAILLHRNYKRSQLKRMSLNGLAPTFDCARQSRDNGFDNDRVTSGPVSPFAAICPRILRPANEHAFRGSRSSVLLIGILSFRRFGLNGVILVPGRIWLKALSYILWGRFHKMKIVSALTRGIKLYSISSLSNYWSLFKYYTGYIRAEDFDAGIGSLKKSWLLKKWSQSLKDWHVAYLCSWNNWTNMYCFRRVNKPFKKLARMIEGFILETIFPNVYVFWEEITNTLVPLIFVQLIILFFAPSRFHRSRFCFEPFTSDPEIQLIHSKINTSP